MNLNGVLSILLIVLVLAIIILAFIYLNMTLKEKNSSKTNQNKKNNAKKDGDTSFKAFKEYNVQSIFNFMEFEKIEDNLIIQKNGKKFLMLIECQGINYDLMSEVEKNAVETGFMKVLNTLREPIQIYIQTRTINLENSIQKYKQKLDSIYNDVISNETKYKRMLESNDYTQEEIQKQRIEVVKLENLYSYGKDIIANTERMSLNRNILRKKY